MSQHAPVVFAFSLGDPREQDLLPDIQGRLMKKIAEKATLKIAKNTQEALDSFNGDNRPKAILVTDSGIATKRNKTVSDKLIDFAHNGGIVVIDCLFSSFIRPNDMRSYFKKWNLSWKNGSYQRTTVALNQTAAGVPSSELPTSYSQKALFLADVDSNAAWYLPTESSVLESRVFAPTPVATSETPVAFTKVGNGWLGSVGDVNAEEETDAVVLGMLGLL